MNLEMALKSGSNNLDLDCVKLSLRNFFLSFLMESFFLPAFSIYFYFCLKHTPKSSTFNFWPNFTCGKGSLVLP